MNSVTDLAEFLSRDRKGEFDRKGWDACAEKGVQAMVTRDTVDKVFATLQELGRGTPDVGFLLSLNAHIWGVVWPLHRMENKTFLQDAAAGKTIGTHAISEPDAGSDLHGMKTVATRDGSCGNS